MAEKLSKMQKMLLGIFIGFLVLIIVFHVVKSKASKELNSSDKSVASSAQKTYDIASWVLIILYIIGITAFVIGVGPENIILLIFSLGGGGNPNF